MPERWAYESFGQIVPQYTMRHNQEQGLVDAVAAISFLAIVFDLVGLLILRLLFHVTVDGMALSLLAVLVGLSTFVLAALPFWLLPKTAKWLASWQKCPHGILGGVAHARCPTCVRQAEAESKQRQADEDEHQRKLCISFAADTLRVQESERLYKEQLQDLDLLRKVSPQEFELAICRLFEQLGFTVEHTPFTNDGGKDGLMWKNGAKCVLECKRYGEGNHVGRPELQKFYAAMAEEEAAWGVFVITSAFTDTARAYAARSRLELVDGTKLVGMMRQAYPQDYSGYVRTMCPKCGSEVKFLLDDSVTSLLCPLGHTVSKPSIVPRPTAADMASLSTLHHHRPGHRVRWQR